MVSVFTSSTWTLKSCSTAPLIWYLLARRSTSNRYCPCSSRNWVPFSVTTGRRMISKSSIVPHALDNRLQGAFRQNQVIIFQNIIDVEALGAQHLEALQVTHRFLDRLVG